MSEFLPLIFNAAITRSADIAQLVVFAITVFIGLTMWLGIPASWTTKLINWATGAKALALVFVAVIITRLAMAPYWVWQDERAARIKAEAALQRTKDTLESAQAALTAKGDRTATIEKLREFYASGRPLSERGGLNANSSEAELNEYIQDTGKWADEVEAWLRENMGTGAAEFFRDESSYRQGRYWWHSNTVNDQHNWRMNLMDYWRGNLKKLIESDKWDKPNGTR